jgi:hypothetical protein
VRSKEGKRWLRTGSCDQPVRLIVSSEKDRMDVLTIQLSTGRKVLPIFSHDEEAGEFVHYSSEAWKNWLADQEDLSEGARFGALEIRHRHWLGWIRGRGFTSRWCSIS